MDRPDDSVDGDSNGDGASASNGNSNDGGTASNSGGGNGAGNSNDGGTAASAGVAVIDIDGVVADVRHRLHHLRRRPARWDRFFAAAVDDPVLGVGADVVREIAAGHPVVWLSGRPESLRDVTQRWLAANDLPAGKLLLRPNGDYRPAARFKLDVVRNLAEADGVAAALDDDPAVVHALRAAGFPVVLADWVPRERALDHAQERDGRT